MKYIDKTELNLDIRIETENGVEFKNLTDEYKEKLADIIMNNNLQFDKNDNCSVLVNVEEKEPVTVKLHNGRDEDTGFSAFTSKYASKDGVMEVLNIANEGPCVVNVELPLPYLFTEIDIENHKDPENIIGTMEINKNAYEFSYDSEYGRFNSINRANDPVKQNLCVKEDEHETLPSLFEDNYSMYQIESAMEEELDNVRQLELDNER